MKYTPQNFEKKWMEVWEKERVYEVDNQVDKKKKQFVFPMFPYPSGAGLHVGHVRVYTGTDVIARFYRMNDYKVPYPSGAGLHVGHVRVYTGTDVIARFYRMNGYKVLHSIGWDAFGLPAENTAIKEKKNPMDMVPENIKNFKRQVKMLGFSYDFTREYSTTDPAYYKWTQWLFIQFYKMGLLYKKSAPINYCPKCKTGLAEEEVLPDGTHERCGNPITKKELPQWVFKITQYADKLMDDLKDLDWPEGILEMQRNWIGRSEGTEVKFEILNSKLQTKYINVFTTRADTLFGVTALVVAPEHKIVNEIVNSKSQIPNDKFEEIKKYVEEARRKSELVRTDLAKEKTGVFTGLYVIHPLTKEEIPLWIADYVVGWYGEGAVMVVPAHDERDFEFAKKYQLSIKKVVVREKSDKDSKIKEVLTDYGYLINSGEFNGLTSEEAIKKITEKLESLNLGKKRVSYKLRDWIFSRQRYWGEPIPMVFCAKCAKNKIRNSKFEIRNEMLGWFPIPEDQLPLELPYVKSYEPTGTGESPLSQIKEFINTTCPNCGGPAKREADTMPNWAGSCWYFLAYCFWNEPKLREIKPSLENWNKYIKPLISKWLPADWYLGGAEHAVLHLLYSRFWIKALYDAGLLDFEEPFLRLRNVGMVLAEDHRKMSKSLGNVVNPDDVLEEYGADALRVYEMFMAPFDSEIAWSTKALQGAYRFVKRVWEIFYKFKIKNEKLKIKEDSNLVRKLNKTIKKVTDDIPKVKFNTAIAAMMEFLNEWEKKWNVDRRALNIENAKKFLKILSPFTPFLTEEIWREVFEEKTSIHLSRWPKAEAVEDEEVIIPVQVNGKVRDTIKIKVSKINDQKYVEEIALKSEKVKKYLKEKPKKVIYIKGKIVNFIV